jgi:RNA polymerase sigma-70 factor, ECF subfamily
MSYITEIETKKLVTNLQDKSEAAFSDLYDAYAAVLFGVAFRIVNNKAVAEELFQDAFVKVWRNIDSFDSEKGSLFTWMLNITQNTCKDYLRSRQYRYHTLMTKAGLDQLSSKYIPQTTINPGEILDLHQQVQKLEPKYKDIIDLVYVFGYSQEQVSKELNLPLGTVKTRSRAALKQLKSLYFL